jgi:hypothetical protein
VAAAESSQTGSVARADYLREQIRKLARRRSEMPDSARGRRQRADALRAEIDEIKHDSGSPQRTPVSPREFTDEAAAKTAGADDAAERTQSDAAERP